MELYALRTNGRDTPLEVDTGPVVFTWKYRSDAPGTTAAEVAVTVRAADGETVWSSGSVPGDPVRLPYAGPDLQPHTAHTWTLRVTDTDGAASEAAARFDTGPMATSWPARWVSRTPHPWFDEHGRPRDTRQPTPLPRSWRTTYSEPPLRARRSFVLDRPVARAKLYVTARGVYRAHLNGHRVGADELTPGWTAYESVLEYQGYDVTHLLQDGSNVLAAEVADGWWSGYVGYDTRSQARQYGARPELLAHLVVQDPDGGRLDVATDESWVELPGEIVMSDLLMGEYHDDAMGTDGWTSPGFDDSGWRPVHVGSDPVDGLRGQLADSVAVVDRVPARSVTQVEGGQLVDFGQNLVGRVRLELSGQRPGAVVTLRHGEMLDGDRLYTGNLRTAEATDRCVVPPSGSLVFEPRFTLHGFRYVEVSGHVPNLEADHAVAVVLSSDRSPAGELHTSSELVNQLVSNIRWGQRGNLVAVPTDCPQRDERLGWTADAHIFARTATFNADVHMFFERWLRDLRIAQDESGNVPDVIPLPPSSAATFATAAPGWGDAVVLLPWTLYTVYGAEEQLRAALPSMRAWVDHVFRENDDGLWCQRLGNNYGDWLSPGETASPLVVAGAFQVRSTDVVAAALRATGDASTAAVYELRARRLRELFVDAFVTGGPDDADIEGGGQSAYLFALAWDLVPDELRGSLAGRLVDDLEARDRHLSCGFLGGVLLCPTLTAIGRADLAYDVLFQETYPSWGYTIAQGATTIWERWDGWQPETGFQSETMNSFNHYAFGSVGEWLYRQVAGIDQAPGSVGYRRLLIEPRLTSRLDVVEAAFDSPRGRVEVAWRRRDDQVRVDVLVPPGSTATVVLPGLRREVSSGPHSFEVPFRE